MIYPLYIFFGLAPSLIWLLFFLRKDSHPESNRMVIKIFFLGALSAIAAALIEISLFKGFVEREIFNISPFLLFLLYNLIGIAFVEELFKYLVVKTWVLNNKEFDEPVDAMLYMIIAALGFASLENLLVFFPYGQNLVIGKAFAVSLFRFIGATFLHALASGIVGYLLALAVFGKKKKLHLASLALVIVAVLHAAYNLSIMKIEEQKYLILIPIGIIISLAFLVMHGFRKLKKLQT